MKKKCGGTSEEDLKNIEKDYGMLPKPESSNEYMDLNDEDLDMLPDYESSSNESIDLNDENLDMLPDYESPNKKSSSSKKFFPRPKLTKAQKDARKKRKEKLKVKKTLNKNKNKIRYQSRKKIADKRPRVKGRFVKTDKVIKKGGMGPTSDDRRYMMEMRKRYMADSINPGLPLDMAPKRSKSKSSPKKKLPPKKKPSPPKKKPSPPKKKPSPPKPSQYNPLMKYQNLTPAQKKKYKKEIIKTKSRASSRRISGRNITPFIRM